VKPKTLGFISPKTYPLLIALIFIDFARGTPLRISRISIDFARGVP
jgi:hypothetical protein